jgi:hypothetical protein
LGEFLPTGRIFSLASLLKLSEVVQILGLLFPQYQLCITFDKKIRWATFWATFSHLVTLVTKFNLLKDQNFDYMCNLLIWSRQDYVGINAAECG